MANWPALYRLPLFASSTPPNRTLAKNILGPSAAPLPQHGRAKQRVRFQDSTHPAVCAPWPRCACAKFTGIHPGRKMMEASAERRRNPVGPASIGPRQHAAASRPARYSTAMVGEFQPPLWITFVVLFTLAVVFAASWWMFFSLVHRWTSARPWFALSDWAKERGFHFARVPDAPADPAAAPAPLPLPPPLEMLADQEAQAITVLTDHKLQLIEFRWHAPPPPPASSPDAGPQANPAKWTPGHVLLQAIDDPWPPTGLRPVDHATSLLDTLIPAGTAVSGSNERFAVLGQDLAATRLLAASSVRALLPADVGFLLFGQTLMLDFSARPFDPIELDRMLAVADQVAAHVPRLTRFG
jgi:hypothetical protein